jgi:hypothetical protein
MAINHGPLDMTLDKRDDRQLETEEAMIDVATLRGQEKKCGKHHCLLSCYTPKLRRIAFRGKVCIRISESFLCYVS